MLNLSANNLILGKDADGCSVNITHIQNPTSLDSLPKVKVNGVVPGSGDDHIPKSVVDKLTTYYFTEIPMTAADQRGSDGGTPTETYYPFTCFTDQLTYFYPFDGNGLQKAGKFTLEELADTIMTGTITVRYSNPGIWTPTEWDGTGDRPTAPTKPGDSWVFPSFIPAFQNRLITWRNLMWTVNYPLTKPNIQLHLPRFDTAPVINLATPTMVNFNSVLDPLNLSGGDFFPNVYRFTDGQHQGTVADPCLTGLQFTYRGNADNEPSSPMILPQSQLVWFTPTQYRFT